MSANDVRAWPGADANAESQRLQALKALDVLDSAPEPAFDALARAAAIACDAPIALISLIDANRQWFKANIGLQGISETRRADSFCTHTIQGDGLFEVSSADQDPCFADLPIVAADPRIRFYAGAPITLGDGSRVGTLCVLDRASRSLNDRQREALLCLAQAVSHALDGRRAARNMQRMATDLDRLSLVARRTSNAVVITDTARRITWVNEGFERMTGYRADEAIGRSPATLLQFEGTDLNTVQQLREALAAARSFKGEILNRGKDGRTYWLDIEIQPLHDEHGQLAGFMALELDITERKRVSAALQASMGLLDATGRIAGVAGWEFDPTKREFHWTEQMCHILDLPPGSSAGDEAFMGDFATEIQPFVQRAIDRQHEVERRWSHEFTLTTKAGRTLWVHAAGEGEYDDRGLVRIIGAVQDITAQWQLKLELERSAQLLRGAIDTLDEAFVLYDPDDRLALCNDKYRAMYATSSDLLVPGARFEDVVREGARRGQYQEAVGRVDEWVAERLASHRSGNSTLMQTIDDGRTLRIVERRMPDGHTVGFRIDVTDLVRAKEAAERANRAQAEFIATLSHELRTPLQSIIGFAELGGLIAETEPQFKGMFADIHAGGHRMLRLVNGLLDVTKIDGTEGSLALEPADLTVLIAAVGTELLPLTIERRLRIDLPQPGPPVMARVDAFRFQQVVRNVLANAIRFAPPDSVIDVSLVDHGPAGVEVGIRDRGPGIPPDELTAIFDAFVQSSRTRDGSGGTGLGLTICRKIVSACGGRIVASNADGGGAHLSIWLPAADGPGTPAANGPLSPAETSIHSTGTVHEPAHRVDHRRPARHPEADPHDARIQGLHGA